MQVTEDVISIREKRLPVSVAWSRNDKMIEEKLSRDLLNTLGIHQDVKKNQDQGITEIKLNSIYRIYKNSVQSVHCFECKVHDQN